METCKLGRVDHESSVVSLGAFAVDVDAVNQTTAGAASERALEYGVNHIDVAPSDARVLECLAPWMPKISDDVFLGSKTARRAKSEA